MFVNTPFFNSTRKSICISYFHTHSLIFCIMHSILRNTKQGNRETAAMMLSYMRAEGVTAAAVGTERIAGP